MPRNHLLPPAEGDIPPSILPALYQTAISQVPHLPAVQITLETYLIRTKLLPLAGVLSAVLFAHAATPKAVAPTQPQIAFVGDSLTVNWGQQPQFQAHSNWLPYGASITPFTGIQAGTEAALATVQAIIASGKKPVIFLNVGESNSEDGTPGNQHSSIFAFWAQGWEAVIQAAQQAKLPIIVSTIAYSDIGDVSDMNKWILTYAPAHGIPVVNIDYALNSGKGFAASGHGSQEPGQPAIPQAPVYYAAPFDPNTNPSHTLTSQAWDLITDMAEVAIGTYTGAIKLKGGYLGTVEYNENEDAMSIPSANTTVDGSIVQFTAYGQYSDGSTHIFNNADIYGNTGIWTTSNPLALSMDQTGVGRGLDAGKTNIKFITPSGVTLNEWTMTTYVSIYGCGACATY
jgi:hypothetical protein